MTVGGNIGVVPQLEGWTADRIAARVGEMLDLIGLDRKTFENRWPDELSGFGALDPITRVELHDEFKRIQARVKKTIVIVTHDMREAFALATRIGVLDEGVLIACDTPDKLSSAADPRVKQLLES
jgi:osmoprotectant transport system ATP-binding protein